MRRERLVVLVYRRDHAGAHGAYLAPDETFGLAVSPGAREVTLDSVILPPYDAEKEAAFVASGAPETSRPCAHHADEAAREAKRARHAAPRLALESGRKKIAAAAALAAAAEAEEAKRAEADAAAAATAATAERPCMLRGEREALLEARAAGGTGRARKAAQSEREADAKLVAAAGGGAQRSCPEPARPSV